MRIKLPLTQIQYLCEVPGFRSAGHIYSTSSHLWLAVAMDSAKSLAFEVACRVSENWRWVCKGVLSTA